MSVHKVLPNESQLAYLKEMQQAYSRVFGSEDGKKVLKDIRKRCFVDTTTFLGDKDVAIYNEGSRAVYLSIKTMLTLDFSKFEEPAEGAGSVEEQGQQQ